MVLFISFQLPLPHTGLRHPPLSFPLVGSPLFSCLFTRGGINELPSRRRCPQSLHCKCAASTRVCKHAALTSIITLLTPPLPETPNPTHTHTHRGCSLLRTRWACCLDEPHHQLFFFSPGFSCFPTNPWQSWWISLISLFSPFTSFRSFTLTFPSLGKLHYCDAKLKTESEQQAAHS